ncbi:hypothetical protein COCCADRAFT_102698, partial [Bipolaris zeicola 26-R-13]
PPTFCPSSSPNPPQHKRHSSFLDTHLILAQRIWYLVFSSTTTTLFQRRHPEDPPASTPPRATFRLRSSTSSRSSPVAIMADKGLEDVPEGKFFLLLPKRFRRRRRCCAKMRPPPPQCNSDDDSDNRLTCKTLERTLTNPAQARSSPTTMKSPTPSTT